LITIITATYNSGKTLEKTFDSILNQRIKDIEYIVIDGSSTDNTVEIIMYYEALFANKNIDFKWLSEPDNGIYDAWNKGLKLSRGNWITFLGSDDYYSNNKVLNKVSIFLEQNPDIDWAYSKVNLIDKKGKVVRKFKESWRWSKFKKHMYVPHAGSFHNFSYFKNFGFFDANFKVAGDYEMLLRKKKNLRTIFIDIETVQMLNEGVSNTNVINAFNEEIKAKLKHSIRNSLYCKIDLKLALFKFKLRNIYN
jgi:glycosyltransferase involved in cell wall biosynthesis